MTDKKNIAAFLATYSEPVSSAAMKLREVIFENLPGVLEQMDIPARMIAYSYGQKYAELVCTIIPSQKGLKLGFYKGSDLPDPRGLLRGNGKISRYVEIKSSEEIDFDAIKLLLQAAFIAYKERNNK